MNVAAAGELLLRGQAEGVGHALVPARPARPPTPATSGSTTRPCGRRSSAPPCPVAVFTTDVTVRPFAAKVNNVVRWSEISRAGHFAALEAPGILAADVREFFGGLAGLSVPRRCRDTRARCVRIAVVRWSASRSRRAATISSWSRRYSCRLSAVALRSFRSPHIRPCQAAKLA